MPLTCMKQATGSVVSDPRGQQNQGGNTIFQLEGIQQPVAF